MFTSTLAIALASFLAGNTVEPLLWHTNYDAAQKLAADHRKPLAVFLGSGSSGWKQISRDGTLPDDVWQLLGKRYVCVYIDTAKERGRELAGDFEVRSGPALVVSDATGRYQAFRHEGELSQEQLLRYLNRYADPTRPVRTTETNLTERVSYYSPQSYAAPEAYAAPFRYAPIYASPIGRSC